MVYPFSFRETLRHRDREPDLPPDRLPKAVLSELERDLATYLGSGGFPEILNATIRDRFALLQSYVDGAPLRDVIERHSVSQPTALRWLVRQLLANAAGTFSVNKFHGDLRSPGIPIAKDSLHDFLSHLEDAFLIRTVPLATDSERRRMVNPARCIPSIPV